MKLIALTLIAAACLTAQKRPAGNNPLSPATTTAVKLGASDIEVSYSAPSARGRKVEGGLIPYGEWYRLGADSATTLTASTDIKLGSLKVPKGTHTLFLLATANEWQLIVNKQTGQWGLDYDPKRDLGRVPMTLRKLTTPVEKMKLTLTVTNPKSGLLALEWGMSHAEVVVSLE